VDDRDHKSDLTAQETRGGKQPGAMRYVLHISLALAAHAGIAILSHYEALIAAVTGSKTYA
jgi:hypothetical protein